MQTEENTLNLAYFSSLNLSKEILEKIHLLENYDLSPITSTFTDESHQQGRKFSNEQIYPIVNYFGKADLELAKNIEREFKRFVAITLIRPGKVSAPSGPIDMYWHFFILHTVEYKIFCEKIWGSSEPTTV